VCVFFFFVVVLPFYFGYPSNPSRRPYILNLLLYREYLVS
jgi:hypothetical protein